VGVPGGPSGPVTALRGLATFDLYPGEFAGDHTSITMTFYHTPKDRQARADRHSRLISYA
jgi:hypothetical protein